MTSLCFKRLVAMNALIFFFSRAWLLLSDQYPASARTARGFLLQDALDGTDGRLELVDVAAGRGDVLREDDLTLRIHGDLSVVALDESVRGLLDLRLRIGKVPLGFRLRADPLFVFAFGPRLCAGLLLESRLGLPDLLQPTLPVGQFFGQLFARLVHPVTAVLFLINRRGPTQQIPNLLLKHPFFLLHPRVAHRFVLGGVGLDLGPIHRHLPKLDQPGLPAHQDHLLEKRRKRRPVTFPKITHRSEIRLVASRQKPKRHAVNHLRRDPARRKRSRAVGVQQHLHHHPRVIRGVPSLLPVALLDRPQIQLVHQIPDKTCQMTLRHPVRHARWHQQQLIRLVSPKDFRHESIIHGKIQIRTTPMITRTGS